VARTVSRGTAYWLVFVVFLTAMLGNALPTPLYVLYQAEWHFDAGILTLVFATYSAGVLLSLLLAGRVSDQIGRRPVLAAALVLSALSTVAFLVADGTTWLYVGRLLSGLSAGLVTGTGTAMLSELAGPDRIRQASVLSTVATGGGIGLGPPLAGLLAEYAPHPTLLVFWVYLALLVAVAPALLVVPETRETRTRLVLQFRGLHVPPAERSVFLGACAAAFVSLALAGLFTALAPTILRQVLEVRNHALGGVLVGALFLASCTTQVLLGRQPPRRTVRFSMGLTVGALALVVLSLRVGSVGFFLLTAAVSGIAGGAAFVGSIAVANAAAPPERRGEVVSTYFTAAYLGLAFPVIGVGFAAEHVRLESAVRAFAVALALLCVGTLLATRDRGDLTLPAAGAPPSPR
jgi:MFS family permease